METRQLVALGLAAGVGYVGWRWGLAAPELAAGLALNTFARGARLNSTSYPDGVVPDDPDDLVSEASAAYGDTIDRETYALARMGRSEGVDGMEYRMHVALNDLDKLQQTYGTNVYSSVWALMLHSKVARADGHFSEQHLGKRYATDRDPYAGDVDLARKVRSDRSNGVDLVGGATKFVDVDSFKVQPGTGTYDETVAQWAAEGYAPTTLPGASSNFVVFTRAA